jgi:hypothetical protein
VVVARQLEGTGVRQLDGTGGSGLLYVKPPFREVDFWNGGSPGPKVVSLTAGKHTIEVRNMLTKVFESHLDVHARSHTWLLYVQPPFRKSQSPIIRIWPLGGTLVDIVVSRAVD